MSLKVSLLMEMKTLNCYFSAGFESGNVPSMGVIVFRSITEEMIRKLLVLFQIKQRRCETFPKGLTKREQD